MTPHAPSDTPPPTGPPDPTGAESIRPDAAHPAPDAPKRTKVRTRVPKKPARRSMMERVLDSVTTTRMPPGMGFQGD